MDYENERMFQSFQICFILARILDGTYCAYMVNFILMAGLTSQEGYKLLCIKGGE